MTEEGEVRLVQCVMEDFMNTYDERQWAGLEEMMALSAAGDVAIPELEMTDAVKEQPVTVKEEVHEEQPVATFHPNLVGQRWTWLCTVTEMAEGVGPSLGAHAAAVTGAQSHRRAGRWCRRRQRRRPSRTVGPPLDVAAYINLTGDDDDNRGA
uniref:Uncharacterized protein n=1 Tax=Hordeum vulgare subsp. vulgare TaxID=112509 RepID=A0A8I6Y8R9_HORVV